jgi:hypothetical protein
MPKHILKTRPTDQSVATFLAAIPDPETRKACATLARVMTKVTKAAPKMWGTGIVGFGTCHYLYESGREGDWMLTGFSPRASNITVYVMTGFEGEKALLRQLGKYRTGKSCLYFKRLGDIDLAVLEQLLARSVRRLKTTSGPQ